MNEILPMNDLTEKDKPNIGLVTVPIGDNGIIPLSNLLDILYSISDHVHVVTGGSGYTFVKGRGGIVYNIGEKKNIENIFIDIITAVIIRLRIAYMLAKISKNVDLWIFFIGGDGLLPATIVAKLYKKPVLLALAGSAIDGLKYGKSPLAKLRIRIIKINRILSDEIIIYSKGCIKKWDLEKHKNKIYVAHKHHLDFYKFNVKKKFDKRNNIVGYIGALTEGKGVLNFVKAIPEIIKEREDIEFLIGGNGHLMQHIQKYLQEHDLNSKVKLVGWIPHTEIPDYLNELKLFVLPSYTEGLPNIMLEAMACGTPVLVTPVGAIPDVIRNEETGFMIKDNSPECVAKSVLMALECSNLEEIAKNARVIVEREFTYEKAVEMYRNILENTSKKL